MDKPIKKTATAKAVKIAPRKKPVKKTGVTKLVKLTDKQRFENVIFLIRENGFSLVKALKNNKISSETFYKWLDFGIDAKDEESPQFTKLAYTRACEQREALIFDEIIEIADDSSQDKIIKKSKSGNEYECENFEFVNRSRLKIDARKWILGKLNPTKYGDKTTISGDKENPLQVVHNVVSLGSGIDPNQTEEIKVIE
jgi:hypothetical protein